MDIENGPKNNSPYLASSTIKKKKNSSRPYFSVSSSRYWEYIRARCIHPGVNDIQPPAHQSHRERELCREIKKILPSNIHKEERKEKEKKKVGLDISDHSWRTIITAIITSSSTVLAAKPQTKKEEKKKDGRNIKLKKKFRGRVHIIFRPAIYIFFDPRLSLSYTVRCIGFYSFVEKIIKKKTGLAPGSRRRPCLPSTFCFFIFSLVQRQFKIGEKENSNLIQKLRGG